jgi:hypothetical protein
LFQYLRDQLDALFDHYPTLRRNFGNSVYAASTFNLGPSTVCFKHADGGNVAHALCAITSAGDYDPMEGGHIILFSLKLVIEFPPGSSVLIPSAIVPHANTPIRKHESRFSFTQYCAGGLMRWVNYGFRSAKSILAEKGGRQKISAIDGVGDVRWKDKLNLFSKVDELQADRVEVFKK